MRQVMQALLFPLLILLTLILSTGCAPTPATPAVIRGKVTMGGDPVSDLTVELASNGDSHEATTSADGSFAFTDVADGTSTLSLTTTIEETECEVSTTIHDVEPGDTLTVDINIPTALKPPDVVAIGGVGYVAGDLNLVCD